MMTATFLSSLDSTAVSTALPTIAGELGGIDQLPWVLTAYLLGSVAATPLYGKLSDIYGRRALTEAALTIFIVTSAMAAASQTMWQLVVSRGLQGIGGGGLMAMGFIVIGDIFSPRERGRYMGYYTMNFAASALAGPVIGGVFVDVASWRWIFLVNVPLGLITIAIIHTNLTFRLPARVRNLDLTGSAILVSGVTTLVLGVALGGGDGSYGWASPLILALLSWSIVSTALFIWWESRASEPVLPMRLFSNRTFAILTWGNFTYGVVGMATFSFLPLFFQVSLGEAPTTAGLVLAASTLCVPVGSWFAGRVISDTGRYRWLVLTAPVLTLLTNLGFTTFDVDSSIYDAIPWLVVAGFAMGIIYPTMTTATQNSLTLVDLGAGTAAINFFRSLGSTIGVGALGALLTSTINHELGRLDATERGALDVDELLSTPQDIQALEPTLRMAVENAVAVATNLIMWSAVPVITLFCVIAWFLPELELRTTTALADAEAEQSGGAATPG
jgi:EmrB/QacA subfamily drug resistance transporter